MNYVAVRDDVGLKNTAFQLLKLLISCLCLENVSNNIQSLSRKCAELAWHPVAVGDTQSACSVSLALESRV